MTDDRSKQSAYAAAGVDIDAANETLARMREAIRSTYTPEVLSDVGSFGGLFSAAAFKDLSDPVLVASTDGVGTKTMVAARLGRWEGIGRDLVNHCINDVLVQGARPLFFLDYVASAALEPAVTAAVVDGIAAACREAGIALLGGETAEMPGVYKSGQMDVVGTVVGVADRPTLITGERIIAGDAGLALPSSGLLTNGYSLARSALAAFDWTSPRDELGGATIGEALLAMHRSYLPEINALRAADIDIKGLAHITGGGIVENLPRILPEGLGARLASAMWRTPPIFDLIAEAGSVPDDEMRRVINLGVGMLVVLPAGQAPVALNTLAEDTGATDPVLAGEIVSGEGVVIA
ncbi:MAG: phosphoribosylformylglycinamidine cyclo-ligase [Anaerolineae bacterium]